MDSSNFEWKQVQHEHFDHGDYSFDVNKAKRIIEKNPRPVYFISVESLKKASKETAIDRTLSKNVKLDIPIIMITLDGDELLCIDGYHRIRKAIRNKIEKLMCVILDKKETLQILMG